MEDMELINQLWYNHSTEGQKLLGATILFTAAREALKDLLTDGHQISDVDALIASKIQITAEERRLLS